MADLLRADYKDDVLNTEVNTQRKYQMITNADGTVSFVDVTDYSQVGDSFSGADINKTNEAVNELNNAMVKYNEDTDALDVYANGVLVGSLPCGFQGFGIYNNGNEGVALDYSSYTTYASDGTLYTKTEPTVGDSNIVLNVTKNALSSSAFGTNVAVDLSSYRKLVMNYTYGGSARTMEVDISSVNTSAYIGVSLRCSGSAATTMTLCVTTAKPKFLEKTIAKSALASSSEVSSATSAYLTASITKIWLS